MLLEVASEDDWAQGVAGYRFFSLEAAADLLDGAAAIERGTMEASDAIENIDTEYYTLIPSDETLAEALEQSLRGRSAHFAPASADDA